MIRIATSLICVSATLLLASCVAPRGGGDPVLEAARNYQRDGKKLAKGQTLDALGPYLSAAEDAWRNRNQTSNPDEARQIYNECSAEIARLIFESGTGWQKEYKIEHGGKPLILRTRTAGKGQIDPRFFDELLLAKSLKLPSDLPRYSHEGWGAAMAARHLKREGDDSFVPNPGLVLPVTAFLTFPSENKAELHFYDNQLTTTARENGKSIPLSADLSAPVSVWLDHIPKENIGWKGMIKPEAYQANMGLYMTEPWRPDKIPVIMVHGLQSRPKVWANAYNTLNGDPEIRRRYQFLYYQYPTGFPIAYNAAGLRRELERFRDTYDPNHKSKDMSRMVLIGHSMGGILSNIQIRNGGEAVRAKIFKPETSEADLTQQEIDVIRELTDFKANPDIKRVVFVCSPHRGSQIASGSIGYLGNRLISYSIDILFNIDEVKRSILTADARQLFDQGATSITDLQPDSSTLTTILELDTDPDVEFHSIIGDRGRGDTPNSSDGVVAYSSSHLRDATSEIIVPYDHGAPRHEQTIEELRRILYHHYRNTN